MTPKPVSISDKFALFSEAWSPKRVGRIDGYDVRLVRLQGGVSVASSCRH